MAGPRLLRQPHPQCDSALTTPLSFLSSCAIESLTAFAQASSFPLVNSYSPIKTQCKLLFGKAFLDLPEATIMP